MNEPPHLLLTGDPLRLSDVEAVARRGHRVRLADSALRRVTQSRSSLESAINSGKALYGVNTGFGSLGRKRISDDQLRDVQRNLLRSHAAGVGEPLPRETVRAMLLLLAASLSRGHSGVRPVVVEQLVDLLNADITPVVPSVGSVGASGDLAPLAHAALVLIGEGRATVGEDATPIDGGEALRRAKLEPIELGAKEGLALINGTHLMAAQGALALCDVQRLVPAALCAAAMSIDGCRGTDAFLEGRVHEVRRQHGQADVARRLRELLSGSQIIPSHLHDDPRVQDPYSLRCAPVVIGAALDQMAQVRTIVERELGAVTDNPLVFEQPGGADRVVVSAGNFHGMPLALQLDTLTMALSLIAGIAERRVYYMLSASDSENSLHAHLSPQPGLHSGLMIVQYTAAACCNELITLSSPASVANIPTSAGMEDFNSFGPRAAAKARRAIELCENVVAIELLCAAEAIEYQRPLRSGAGVEAAHALVRSVAPKLTQDRPPAPDIAAIVRLIRDGVFEA